MLVLGITSAIFLVVGGLLVYVLLRYRHRANDVNAHQEPPQIYGSSQIELSWTVIPILIVVMLFLATARIISCHGRRAQAGNGAGRNRNWAPVLVGVSLSEARHRNCKRVACSGERPKHPTPTYLTMSSADTNHSFWVPRLAGKVDVIPNRLNTLWIDPEAPGCTWGSVRSTAGPSTP